VKNRAVHRKLRCGICRCLKDDVLVERPGGGRAHASCLAAWHERRALGKKLAQLTPEQRRAMAVEADKFKLQSKVIAALEAAKKRKTTT
jgi:hypothetical protein